jgi:hypothetical protein
VHLIFELVAGAVANLQDKTIFLSSAAVQREDTGISPEESTVAGSKAEAN